VCLSNTTANERGMLQGWNSLLVRPLPLLTKNIKVQVNKQKPNNVRPAQMKHNSDKIKGLLLQCVASLAAIPILCLQFNKFTTRFTNNILKEQGAE
jgi:hypothetical protein